MFRHRTFKDIVQDTRIFPTNCAFPQSSSASTECSFLWLSTLKNARYYDLWAEVKTRRKRSSCAWEARQVEERIEDCKHGLLIGLLRDECMHTITVWGSNNTLQISAASGNVEALRTKHVGKHACISQCIGCEPWPSALNAACKDESQNSRGEAANDASDQPHTRLH